MASSSLTPNDYFSSARPALRPRTSVSTTTPAHAVSPLTPLLSRSSASQYNSPGASFRSEQEEQIIYELGARHFSAGFAGESRPRCIHYFSREDGRRVGDYRACDPGYRPHRRKRRRELQPDEDEEGWSEAEEVELYRSDVRALDLGLVEDKLERVVRAVHTDYLQLDQKPRKAILVIPSLLPTPVVEIALKVLFQHYAQPPTIALLTTPLLACVAAGLRDAIVVDIGWQETVITAVGEYKEVASRRTVRAGKRLVREMASLLEEEARNQLELRGNGDSDAEVTFAYAEEVTRRMGWCKPRPASASTGSDKEEATDMRKIPSPSQDDSRHLHIPFTRFSKPAETVLCPLSTDTCDDHDLSPFNLAYRVLLSLPPDLRALCTSRIIITGGVSNLPGLKPRLIHELATIIESRGWDHVNNYGSAKGAPNKALRERSVNIKQHSTAAKPQPQKPPKKKARSPDMRIAVGRKLFNDNVTRSERVPDDIQPLVMRQVVSEGRRGKVENVSLRAVKSVGAWSGASLLASLKVKGVHEVERDDFLKHGLRGEGVVVL